MGNANSTKKLKKIKLILLFFNRVATQLDMTANKTVLIVCILVMSVLSLTTAQLGHETRKYFLLQDGFTNLNAAAFGNVCNDSATSQSKHYKIMESNPNTWFRGVYQAVMNNARSRIAKYISANQDNLVLVENASAAINAVMRSLADGLNLGKGDAVL
jgi:hypothetical protein